VIIEAESRCVRLATSAVDDAICLLICASRWFARWKS
jgi:hypothetical protein